MIFSKFLQSLILSIPLLGGITAYMGVSESYAATSSDKTTNKKKFAEVTVTPTEKSNDSIEASIREQLKGLTAIPKKTPISSPPIEIIKQEAKGVLIQKNDNLHVTITSDEAISGAAVFTEGLNWYVVLAGVTELKLEEYDKEKLQNLKGVSLIKREGIATILKISLKRKQSPEVTQNPKQISLQFQNKPDVTTSDDLITLPERPDDIYQIRVKGGYTSVEFEDKETNSMFWSLTMETPFRTINEHSYPEFVLLESRLGFGVQQISEELSIDYKKRKINITKEGGLAVSSRVDSVINGKPQSIFSEFKPGHAQERVIGLARYIQSNSGDNLEKSIELVWQYLGLGRVPEALNMLTIMKERYPDLVLMPTFRALDGLSQLLQNRVKKSEQSLKVLRYDPEPQFWYLIASASQNEFIDSDSLHKLSNYKGHFSLLPSPLQTRLLALILQTAILHKDTDVLQAYVDKNPTSQDIFVDQLVALAKALISLSQNQKLKAEKRLEILSQNPTSQRVATIANFELVKLRKELKKIKTEEELATLNRLRFSWRGDFLEYYISKYYVGRLNEEKLYAKALPILRSLTKYFPEQAHRDKLPQLMQQNLINYFHLQPAPPVMESLSIFQEFGDIAPDNEEGDEIIIQATNKIMQLNLYQEAVDIFNGYIDKKLKGDNSVEPRRNKFLYRIAAIELLLKKPANSLKTLEKINNPAESMKEELILLKAEALRQSGQMKEAMALLGDTAAQTEKKATFYFLEENWVEAALHYQKAIDLFGEKDKDNREKAIVNLTLCFALQKSKEKLAAMKEIYGESMQTSKYRDTFNFLTTDTDFNSAVTTAEFTKIETFSDALKKIFTENGKGSVPLSKSP